MALLTDYFAAADDADAGRCLDNGPKKAGLPVVEATSLDPVVTMATLEGILTDSDARAIVKTNAGAVIAETEEPGAWVVALRESLVKALEPPDAQRLFDAAGRWAVTEELAGSDAQQLYGFLWNLAHLAAWARANGRRLYCWMSL